MHADGAATAVKNQDLGISGNSSRKLHYFSVQDESDMSGFGTSGRPKTSVHLSALGHYRTLARLFDHLVGA
jgi:hypothetical protein